jgi:predicted  nucleic acid-binding Zn-ribbon protein
MPSDLKVVMRLQSLDGRVAELTKEIATLPKHIAEIERKLSGGERKLEADKGALAANQRDRKKMEGDIQLNQSKISKLRDQMLAAKNNEQYRAFQHEIEFCEAEIKKCEDRILDLMGQSEPLDKNVKAAEAALKQEKLQVESEKNEARQRTAKDQEALRQLHEERKGIVAALDPGLVTNYERIKKTRGGIAIAEAVDGRCSRCYISLRPQFFQELKRGDKVMTCESCNRILFYAKPESFEDQFGEPVQGSRV